MKIGGLATGYGRRRFGAGHGSIAEINIVPLVDVVLVLLIIFMLTAHVMEFGMEVNVPETKESSSSVEDLPVVHIFSNARFYLNDGKKVININSLASEIKAKFPEATSVYVRADRDAKWDVVAQVISRLGQAKLGVKVVTKPEDK